MCEKFAWLVYLNFWWEKVWTCIFPPAESEHELEVNWIQGCGANPQDRCARWLQSSILLWLLLLRGMQHCVGMHNKWINHLENFWIRCGWRWHVVSIAIQPVGCPLVRLGQQSNCPLWAHVPTLSGRTKLRNNLRSVIRSPSVHVFCLIHQQQCALSPRNLFFNQVINDTTNTHFTISEDLKSWIIRKRHEAESWIAWSWVQSYIRTREHPPLHSYAWIDETKTRFEQCSHQ